MLRSKILIAALFTALAFGSCEKKVEIPCREITYKQRIPEGYVFDEKKEKFVIKHELYFFVLDGKDTVLVGSYEFENMNVGDCYELPVIKK